MKRSYTKQDVDRRNGKPCVNVKVRHWVDPEKIQKRFECSEDEAIKAIEFAYEHACETFWEDAQDVARENLGYPVKVYSEGRSGGWLVVEGLPNVENWDAIMLSKWRRFEKNVRAEVNYLTSDEQYMESIEANQWYKQGAELYNFIDTANRGVLCIADLKREAVKAGFGPVIRKG